MCVCVCCKVCYKFDYYIIVSIIMRLMTGAAGKGGRKREEAEQRFIN